MVCEYIYPPFSFSWIGRLIELVSQGVLLECLVETELRITYMKPFDIWRAGTLKRKFFSGFWSFIINRTGDLFFWQIALPSTLITDLVVANLEAFGEPALLSPVKYVGRRNAISSTPTTTTEDGTIKIYAVIHCPTFLRGMCRFK